MREAEREAEKRAVKKRKEEAMKLQEAQNEADESQKEVSYKYLFSEPSNMF